MLFISLFYCLLYRSFLQLIYNQIFVLVHESRELSLRELVEDGILELDHLLFRGQQGPPCWDDNAIFAMYNAPLWIMCIHIFGANFQEKKIFCFNF